MKGDIRDMVAEDVIAKLRADLAEANRTITRLQTEATKEQIRHRKGVLRAKQILVRQMAGEIYQWWTKRHGYDKGNVGQQTADHLLKFAVEFIAEEDAL